MFGDKGFGPNDWTKFCHNEPNLNRWGWALFNNSCFKTETLIIFFLIKKARFFLGDVLSPSTFILKKIDPKIIIFTITRTIS